MFNTAPSRRASTHRCRDAPADRRRRRRRRLDLPSALLTTAIVGLLVIAAGGDAPMTGAAAPPADRSAYGAAGTARNGIGGEIAPSPTGGSWPGTGPGANGGPFAFIGAHYGPLWEIPAGPNNSLGVGYCVMEDVSGEGVVSQQPTPVLWDDREMATAAALMATFGGDQVVPYGIDARGTYDLSTGEWREPTLMNHGSATRRRQIAVGFAVRMLVDDASPAGAAAGRKLARDSAVINGAGSDFTALVAGYDMARHLAATADRQHAVGGIRLTILWGTPDGQPPTEPGMYPIRVRVSDATGKPVGFVPVLQLSATGIDGYRTQGAVATVDNSGDTADDLARWNAASSAGWPTWDMAAAMDDDSRLAVHHDPHGADVSDADGIARFTVSISEPTWELAFHAQAPTAEVALYAGTGVQGQITWGHQPQSTSVGEAGSAPSPTTTTTAATPSTTEAPPTTTAPAIAPPKWTASTSTPSTSTPSTSTPSTSTTTSTTTTIPTTTTSPTEAATPPADAAPPALPRTGIEHRSALAAALALLLMGTGLTLATRSHPGSELSCDPARGNRRRRWLPLSSEPG